MTGPKKITADQAAALVKSGDHVVLGSGAGLPFRFVDALVARAGELRDVTLMHSRALGDIPYLAAGMAGSLRHNTFLVYGEARATVARGEADYTPCFLSQIPGLLRSGAFPADVAVAQLSPPDADGNCSYGTYHFYVEAALAAGKTVIGEINAQTPHTTSERMVRFDSLDYVFETDYPLPELSEPKISDVEERIGRNVADLIEDGATLQLGAGSIPDAIARFLGDKRHLGLHSEMISDGAIDLIEKGVIDNSRKTVLPGRSLVSFVLGTRRLYDFIDRNPDVVFRPIDETNDPFTIARNPKVVAVNAALQVDLTGQGNSESLGTYQLSGVGGQIDFARGAAGALDGRFVIALPSTAKGGAISRIVPVLEPGTAVTASRSDVDTVVTEYGAARLKGKSLRERAHALAAIAHPDFRDDLLRHIRERNW